MTKNAHLNPAPMMECAGTGVNMGEPEGFHTEWHENGKKKSERLYKKGKEDGPFIYWCVTSKESGHDKRKINRRFI